MNEFLFRTSFVSLQSQNQTVELLVRKKALLDKIGWKRLTILINCKSWVRKQLMKEKKECVMQE